MHGTARRRPWHDPAHPFEETWAEVDGRPLRVLALGTATALPELVLLPGLGAPLYLGPWVEEMAAWTRVSVLDLPGWHGGRAVSSAPTVTGAADAAARWLVAAGLGPVVVAGHSTGAQSALRVAHLVPDRVQGLVLAGPVLDPAARRLSRLLPRFAITLVRESLPEVPAVLPGYLRSGGLPWLRLVRSCLQERPEERMAGLSMPLLVLTGERDRFAPPAWSARLARAGNGQYLTLPGPHNACFVHPAESAVAVRQAVERWTRRRSRDRSDADA